MVVSAAWGIVLRPKRFLDTRIAVDLEPGTRLKHLDLLGIGGLAANVELDSEPAGRPLVSQDGEDVGRHGRHVAAKLLDAVKVPEVDGNLILVNLHAKPAWLAVKKPRDIGFLGDWFEERVGLILALDGERNGRGFNEEQG
jgi:hypothetical protein